MSDDATRLHLQGERQRLGIEALPDYTPVYEPDHEMLEDAADCSMLMPDKEERSSPSYIGEVMGILAVSLLFAGVLTGVGLIVGYIFRLLHWG